VLSSTYKRTAKLNTSTITLDNIVVMLQCSEGFINKRPAAATRLTLTLVGTALSGADRTRSSSQNTYLPDVQEPQLCVIPGHRFRPWHPGTLLFRRTLQLDQWLSSEHAVERLVQRQGRCTFTQSRGSTSHQRALGRRSDPLESITCLRLATCLRSMSLLRVLHLLISMVHACRPATTSAVLNLGYPLL
jgi:hypothetical protein